MDFDIVLGDHADRLRGQLPLDDAHLVSHAIENGDNNIQSGFERCDVFSELLDNIFLRLRDNLDATDRNQDEEDNETKKNKTFAAHDCPSDLTSIKSRFFASTALNRSLRGAQR